jgi:hypothetical protein
VTGNLKTSDEHREVPSPFQRLCTSDRIHLHSGRTGVIHVMTVITAKGESMMTSTADTGTAPASAAGEPKATKKPSHASRGAHVAKSRAQSDKKATPTKKASKGVKKAKVAREGSKTDKALQLPNRPDGVSVKELMKATQWQAHSVRGFLSGTLKKKMGLRVTSTKLPDGGRTYGIISK